MTLQLYLWTRLNKDKKHPLAIRETKNRKSKFHFIGYAIEKKYWNEKSKSVRKTYPNYEYLETLIAEKMKEFSNGSENYNKASFSSYFQKHIDELRTGKKVADWRKHKVVLRHLQDFSRSLRGTEDVKFRDINGDFLRAMAYYFDGQKLKKSTQNGYFKKLKHLYNQALNDSVFLPTIRNPFEAFDNKTSKPKNNSLNVKEFKGIELFNPHQYYDKELIDNNLIPALLMVRNIFVFQFYMYGIRISDLLLLKWDNVNNGKISYVMRKTGKVKTIILSNSLIERLRFFIPERYRIGFLRQKDNILDCELLFSLPENIRPLLLNELKNKKSEAFDKANVKMKKLRSQTFYKEDNVRIETLRNIINGVANNSEYKNDYIFPLISEEEKARMNEKDFDDYSLHKLIQSKTAQYNKSLKLLNDWFCDVDGQKIKTSLTSHLPRHTFTSISVSLGLDVFTISQSLGHTSIKTTQNYIHTLNNEGVDNEVADIFTKFDKLNEPLIKKTKDIKIVKANSVKKV